MQGTIPLIRTKLRRPFIRPNLVFRPRLQAQIEAGLRGPLTLVIAPAGFGKTTLVAASVAACGMPVAWLTLDRDDNRPGRFLQYLSAALQEADPSLSSENVHPLAEDQPAAPEAVLTGLINSLEASSRETVLVLEDYQLINSPEAHSLVMFLLEHCPCTLHLLVASRSDPPLHLARLRARGQTVDLRATDLRFTPDETAQFLSEVMGLHLDPASVALLAERTEGWIAGLQMAALSMRAREDVSGFIAAFSGTNRYILDYLLEEVLASQTAEIQHFLLCTSILERMCAPLCDAVLKDEGGGMKDETVISHQSSVVSQNSHAKTQSQEDAKFFESTDQLINESTNQLIHQSQGEASRSTNQPSSITQSPNHPVAQSSSFIPHPSAFILDFLERANLFVSALDDGRQWYRYHPLFSDLLKARLQQTQPELMPDLHARAADWYEGNGLAVDAINHVLAGKHWSRAEDLIEQQAMGSISGEPVMALISWLDALPDEHLYGRPWLCVFRAWTLFLRCQAQGVENLLQRAEQILPFANGSGRNQDVLGNVAMIRAYLALFDGDLERAADQVCLADLHLPSSDRIIRSDLLWVQGFLPYLQGDLDSAAVVWAKARDYSLDAGNPYITIASMGQLGRVNRVQGHLQAAIDRYEQGLKIAARYSWQHARLTTFVKKDLADAYLERNDLAKATTMAQEAADETERWGNPSDSAMAQAILAHILCAGGDWDNSRQALDKAAQLCRSHIMYPEVRSRIASCQVRMWLLVGDLPAALRWIEESQLDPAGALSFRLEMDYIALARLLLARKLNQQAATLLARLDGAATAGGRAGSRIEILALQALALQAGGDSRGALSTLSDALTLAEPEGYVRVFLDEGEPMQLLLAQWLAYAPTGSLREYACYLLSLFDGKAHPEPYVLGKASPTGALVEPLSGRELEVLHLVALGRTNPEIAQQLVVSPGTVKAHTASIYRKLDVANRTEAVTRARELGILS